MRNAIAVSTHSRLKAAGIYSFYLLNVQGIAVSTHSRLKAAGPENYIVAAAFAKFQHTAA